MSDPTRRKFLGAAAALPFVDVPGDGDHTQDAYRGAVYTDDETPPESALSPEQIGLTRPTVEDMRDISDGHVAIRPLWEPENPQVAQVSVDLGTLNISSSLGEEEVDQLISELERAKEIAAEYSEES